MTKKPLNQEQALEFWTELQRRVQVGAYLELQHDGSYPEDDGSAESTVLESIDNLEAYAAHTWRMEFWWNHGSETWSLVPIGREATWVVAFRDKNTHEVVGPVWFHECKQKPTLWAQTRCYDNCQYAIMDAQGYGYDNGVPDSVLQRQEWYDKENPS